MNVSNYIYDASTGIIKNLFICDEENLGEHLRLLEIGTSERFAAIDSSLVTDPGSQRIDVTTGAVVDYQPPAPSPDFEWDGRRWVLRSSIERERKILAEIKALDERLVRPMTELLINSDDSVARAVAIGILAEKDKLRTELHQIREGSGNEENTQ